MFAFVIADVGDLPPQRVGLCPFRLREFLPVKRPLNRRDLFLNGGQLRENGAFALDGGGQRGVFAFVFFQRFPPLFERLMLLLVIR